MWKSIPYYAVHDQVIAVISDVRGLCMQVQASWGPSSPLRAKNHSICPRNESLEGVRGGERERFRRSASEERNKHFMFPLIFSFSFEAFGDCPAEKAGLHRTGVSSRSRTLVVRLIQVWVRAPGQPDTMPREEDRL